MAIKKISFIIPCYNEAEVLTEFYRRIDLLAQELLNYNLEFLFVNDGSRDNSAEILNGLAERDKRIKVLHFAKNQGHQIALTAGMDFSTGDVIVTIDADLQDPPELVKEMLAKIGEGYQVVHAQRRKRAGESPFKLITAWIFYKLMSRLSTQELIENCGDFRAFTRPVLRAICGFRERHRFLRGLFVLVGFRQCVIQYDRDRRYAGETKYPFRKMLNLAINAALSFSSSPIRLITWFSFLLWSFSLVYLVKALLDHFFFNRTVPGWTSIIILLTFYTGLTLFSMGIIGSYIGRIFDQGQKRPLYWLQEVRNIDLGSEEYSSDYEEMRISRCIMQENKKKDG